MNCKPNDLAIVVFAMGKHNIGKIVRCVRLFYGGPIGESLWVVDPPLPAFDNSGMADACPDRWLKPLGNPGDDEADLLLAPLPKQDKVPA